MLTILLLALIMAAVGWELGSRITMDDELATAAWAGVYAVAAFFLGYVAGVHKIMGVWN